LPATSHQNGAIVVAWEGQLRRSYHNPFGAHHGHDLKSGQERNSLEPCTHFPAGDELRLCPLRSARNQTRRHAERQLFFRLRRGMRRRPRETTSVATNTRGTFATSGGETQATMRLIYAVTATSHDAYHRIGSRKRRERRWQKCNNPQGSEPEPCGLRLISVTARVFPRLTRESRHSGHRVRWQLSFISNSRLRHSLNSQVGGWMVHRSGPSWVDAVVHSSRYQALPDPLPIHRQGRNAQRLVVRQSSATAGWAN